MSSPSTIRLSLALPIMSSSSIVAATQIVLFLIQEIGRIELDFIQPESPPIAVVRPYRLIGTLLIAANISVAPDDFEAARRFERMIRSLVERQYARRGMPNIDYDLQLV